MGIIYYIILSTLAISLISFVGIITLSKKSFFDKNIGLFISFAAGAILAAVFFDLLPETFEALGNFNFVLVGIILFFIFEANLHWHHHDEECKHQDHKKPVIFLNLFGDALHNFIDGVLIAASFLVNPIVGISTTVAVALHEIPQEIGDFAILVKGGLSKKNAAFWNFFTSIFAVIGGVVGFLFLNSVQGFIPYIIALAAGGLLYIATADILPDLSREKRYGRIIGQIITFVLGVIIIASIIGAFPE